MACGLWAVLEAGASAPVTVRTAGGDDLTIEMEAVPGGYDVVLVGPAVTVFEGEWREP
jgi:diaminopimelate epimerase